ncbi:MAG TPA: hypothetical protein ENN21_11425, partial [Spirochaetes bacterium]|nr:hypothetical protein [Spirochaetota bacterium]
MSLTGNKRPRLKKSSMGRSSPKRTERRVRPGMEGRRRFLVFTVLFMFFAAYTLVAAAAPVEGTLSWEECAALALANHPELLSAREKVKQAKADEGVTRSGLLPQVSAVMDINRSHRETGTI